MNYMSKFFVGAMLLTVPCFGAVKTQKVNSIFDILQLEDKSDCEKFSLINELGKDLSAQGRKALCEKTNKEGETPLLAALENFRYPYIVTLLLLWGANPNTGSVKYKGQTSLHKLAGAFGEKRETTKGIFIHTHDLKISTLEQMIQKGGDLGAQEKLCRRTPVHIAAQQATLPVVKFIVKKLAEQNKLYLLFQKDNYQRDALKFAQEGISKKIQTQEVVEYLSKLKQYENNPDMLKAAIASLE